MPVIHNRGKVMGDKTVARKIIFPQGWDENSQPLKEGKKILEEVLQPGQHKNVTEQQFKHLKANFRDEIVNVDDIKDMQAQFKEKEPEKPREGYVAPEEVDALVEKRAQELAAQRAKDEDGKKIPGDLEPRDALITRIDAMDRSELIALIEQEKLGIEHKNFKAPGALKGAVFAALENRDAAKAEA